MARSPPSRSPPRCDDQRQPSQGRNRHGRKPSEMQCTSWRDRMVARRAISGLRRAGRCYRCDLCDLTGSASTPMRARDGRAGFRERGTRARSRARPTRASPTRARGSAAPAGPSRGRGRRGSCPGQRTVGSVAPASARKPSITRCPRRRSATTGPEHHEVDQRLVERLADVLGVVLGEQVDGRHAQLERRPAGSPSPRPGG